MEHPLNKPITRMLLQNKSGVFHNIQSANKDYDEGLYKCTVIVHLPSGESIQSDDTSKAHLKVYGEFVKITTNCQESISKETLVSCSKAKFPCSLTILLRIPVCVD